MLEAALRAGLRPEVERMAVAAKTDPALPSLAFGLPNFVAGKVGAELTKLRRLRVARPGAFPAVNDSDLVRVSGGCFLEGLEDDGTPRRVCVGSFRIERNEVSQVEFARWTGGRPWRWQPGSVEGPDQPAVGLGVESAESYCVRRGRRLPRRDELAFLLRLDSLTPDRSATGFRCAAD